MEIKRNKPITKQLAEKYGGIWRHVPFHGIWYCDELRLNACYVSEAGYDINGAPMEEAKFLIKGLYVYGLKTGTERYYPFRN